MSDSAKKRSMDKTFRNRRARYRIRARLSGTAERPRLAVHKSLRYIYAQLIDDRVGRTLVQASSLEKGIRAELDSSGNLKAASAVGTVVAERALELGIKSVVFDRGGYVYHGRVKALADAAREKGLQF